MKHWLLKYEHLIQGKSFLQGENDNKNLPYWQNRLFFSFLAYCFPVSFIALIPGVYMAVKDGHPAITIIDIVSLVILMLVTFSNKTEARVRKTITVILFYVLAIFLINELGYIGPGIFYLFFLTILIALINPINYAYWSIAANTVVLLGFALNIHFKIFNSVINSTYTPGAWIAFSSNMIFLSIVITVLIHRIFDGLQLTINKKERLKERYKGIFDESPLPMWLFDTNTLLFLDVNGAAVRHYGYSKEEFLSMSIKDIRPAASAKKLQELVKQNAETGVHYNGNFEHLKKNGEHIYVNIESSLLSLGDNKVRLVLANDITEQLANQLEVFNINQKIKESEANLKAVFESTVKGFVLLDARFNIELFNSKALDYIKFSKQQFEFEKGKNIFDYVESTRHAYFKNMLERVYTGEVIEYDRKYRSPYSPTYWLHYALTPVYEGKKINGICITGSDITERKMYVKMIEEQNKIFREISWMQSHLVRAPLARVMGLIGLLNTVTGDAERAEIINYLSASSTELDDIVKKIIKKSSNIVEKYPDIKEKSEDIV
jgi:PAS domain S-box-containing protein